MDTHLHTPVRPSRAERARTVLASAASASVHWDGGRVDLLGCHRDTADGNIVLTLDAGSSLVRALSEHPDGELPVVAEFTELCPVTARHRVRSRLTLGGWLGPGSTGPGSTGPGSTGPGRAATRATCTRRPPSWSPTSPT